MTNGAPTGSPNVDPSRVNSLVRQRIIKSGVERPRPRATGVSELTRDACDCPDRPRPTESTWVVRHSCTCGRRWEWHCETGSWRRRY